MNFCLKTIYQKDEIWLFILEVQHDKVLLQNQEKNLRDNYPEPKYIFKDSASIK